MALKTVLDTLDSVPQELHSLYAENDGRYVLDVEDVDAHPAVSALKNAYTAEKGKRQTAAQEAAELRKRMEAIPEDFDPELWKRAKGAKPEAVVEVRKEWEAKLAEAEAARQKAEAELRSTRVDRALEDALTAHGVTQAAFVKAARALIGPQVALDDKGRPVVETDMGPMPLADHVKRWIGGEGKAFVTPPAGGGARGKEHGAGGGATVTRQEFDRMSHRDRSAFARAGGKVVDT